MQGSLGSQASKFFRRSLTRDATADSPSIRPTSGYGPAAARSATLPAAAIALERKLAAGKDPHESDCAVDAAGGDASSRTDQCGPSVSDGEPAVHRDQGGELRS